MSKKRSFLKPVEVVVATIIATSSAPALASTLDVPFQKQSVVAQEIKADIPSYHDPLILKPARMMRADYDDASHYSHSSHSSHASHASHYSSSY